jgi:hypothetical protein
VIVEAAQRLRREWTLLDTAPLRAAHRQRRDAASPPPAAKPRGQIIHTLLAHRIPMQARFEDVAQLPPEHWDAALFETLNPRAFLPIQEASQLLQVLGKTAAVRAFKAWSDRFARTDVPDEERDRLSARAFRELLAGGYAWMPALAWILDRMPWEAVVELCRVEFGQDTSQPPATNMRYQYIELAILRENLFRAYAPLEDFWVQAFVVEPECAPLAANHARPGRNGPSGSRGTKAWRQPSGETLAPAADANAFGSLRQSLPASPAPNPSSAAAPAPAPRRFPLLAYRVVHLARIYLVHRHGQRLASGADYAFTGPGPRDDTVLAQGSLGHVIRWNAPDHATQRRAQAVLRQKTEALPEWARLMLRVAN